MKKLKKRFSSASTTTSVDAASGREKTNIRINSHHYFRICNSEESGNYFAFNFILKDQLDNSFNNTNNIFVPGGSCTNGDVHPFLVSYYGQKGTYWIIATSDVNNVPETFSLATNHIYVR